MDPCPQFLNSRFKSIPLEQQLSIDEANLFNKGWAIHKAVQRCVKILVNEGSIYVLSEVSGFPDNFKMYCAKKEYAVLTDGNVDLDVTLNIVYRLACIIPIPSKAKVSYLPQYLLHQYVPSCSPNKIKHLFIEHNCKNLLLNYKLPTEAAL